MMGSYRHWPWQAGTARQPDGFTVWTDNRDGTYLERPRDRRPARTVTRAELNRIAGTHLIVTYDLARIRPSQNTTNAA